MRLSVKSADLAGAKRKGLLAKTAAVAAYVLAAVRDTEPYVPYVSSRLRGTAHSESDPEAGRIVYGSAAVPYARPQYYGCPNKTWPGTTMEWFPRAKERHGQSWLREAEAAAKEATGR